MKLRDLLEGVGNTASWGGKRGFVCCNYATLSKKRKSILKALKKNRFPQIFLFKKNHGKIFMKFNITPQGGFTFESEEIGKAIAYTIKKIAFVLTIFPIILALAYYLGVSPVEILQFL